MQPIGKGSSRCNHPRQCPLQGTLRVPLRDQFHLSLDPELALKYFEEAGHTDGEYCTMCGPNFCAAKLTHDLRKFKK